MIWQFTKDPLFFLKECLTISPLQNWETLSIWFGSKTWLLETCFGSSQSCLADHLLFPLQYTFHHDRSHGMNTPKKHKGVTAYTKLSSRRCLEQNGTFSIILQEVSVSHRPIQRAEELQLPKHLIHITLSHYYISERLHPLYLFAFIPCYTVLVCCSVIRSWSHTLHEDHMGASYKRW